MGKPVSNHPTRADLIEDALRVVHNARDVIANAASELCRAPDMRDLAGRLFVVAELVRIEAIAIRAECSPGTYVAPAFRAPIPPSTEKPKRVRGPYKRKASAAERPVTMSETAAAFAELGHPVERVNGGEP